MIDKVFKIMEAISETKGENSLNVISGMVDIPRSTVHRLLQTMTECGMVEFNQEKGYALSGKLVRICMNGYGDRDFLDIMVPIARDLGSITRETVSVNVMIGLERTCIYRVEGEFPTIRNVKIGTHNPLFIGATGKVLAAYLPRNKFEEALKYAIDTGKVSKDKLTEIMDEIEKCRKQGYAISIEERYAGCGSIAVPIKNQFTGEVLGTLSISSLKERLSDENLKEYVRLLSEAAAKAQSLVMF